MSAVLRALGSLRRFIFASLASSVIFAGLIVCSSPTASAAGTPGGTAITNQASAAFSDASGTPYTGILSNVVTVTVVAVPLVTITAVPSTSVVPGGQYNATYLITNTGNGNGNFTLTGSVAGTDASSATESAYNEIIFSQVPIILGPLGSCTGTDLTYLCPLASVISFVGGTTVSSNSTLTVVAPVNVSNTATLGTAAIVNTTSVTVTYLDENNPGGAGNPVSASSQASINEDVVADSRLDMQKTAVQPGGSGNATAYIKYIINVANGGGKPAMNLPTVASLLGGSAAPGILITDKVPTFAGSPLVVSSVTAKPGTASSYLDTNAKMTMYTTASADASSGWSICTCEAGNVPTTATYVGVLISGGSGSEINNSNTTAAGNVSDLNASVVITMLVTPPAGTGSGTANAVVNEANSVIGGNQPNPNPITGVDNMPLNVNGPGIAVSTTSIVAAIDSGNQGILYPTQAYNFTPTTPLQNGTSNAVGAQANAAYAVFDGPFLNPEAIGSYNGSAPSDDLNDFTAVSYLPPGFIPTNTSSTTYIGNPVGAASTVTVYNTIQNIGNQADGLTVSISAPTGWGVQIYAATTAPLITGSVLAGTMSSNSATYTWAAVPSGPSGGTANTVNYAVTYTLPGTVQAFTVYDIPNTVTSVGSGTITNTTHNELIPGAPFALLTTATSPTCPTGIIPGCVIIFDVKYANTALAATYCQPGTASPSTEANGFYIRGVTITEDAAAPNNTWGTAYATGKYNTTGLTVVATDTLTSTTFPTGNTVGSYAFTALVGGSSSYSLAPGCNGDIKFSVTVGS